MTIFSSRTRSLALICILICAFFLPRIAGAYSVEKLNIELKNDFVLEPAKIDLALDPGQVYTRSVMVTNRADKKITFKIEVEDFVGSDNPQNQVVLLGKDKSPYSFKDNIKPEVSEVTLNPGERLTLPVTITVPPNTAPGGYYSSVLFSNEPAENTPTGGAPVTKIISRLGVLFLIRVNGPANEKGSIDDFRISPPKMVYDKADFNFEVLFKNEGNVHLVPYGWITIKNMLGAQVDQVPINAYFALPNTIRYREVPWTRASLFGRYTATLTLHLGYGDQVQEKTIAFWVIPWKVITAVFLALLVFLSIFYYILSRFEFRRKK